MVKIFTVSNMIWVQITLVTFLLEFCSLFIKKKVKIKKLKWVVITQSWIPITGQPLYYIGGRWLLLNKIAMKSEIPKLTLSSLISNLIMSTFYYLRNIYDIKHLIWFTNSLTYFKYLTPFENIILWSLAPSVANLK